ncbi:MAG TPA: hypothetical protein VNJ02_15780 [Vicinamibacterales bacterium]|nr:hypothetical protein [Vicinamibacterales bacterium]
MSAQRFARAAIGGAIVLIVCDFGLHVALAVIRPDAYGPLASWAIPRLTDRSIWLIAAVIIWLSAGSGGGIFHNEPKPLHLVGTLMVALPIIWAAATMVVLALRVTVSGTWASQGEIFLSGHYYSEIIISLAPWLLAGGVLVLTARHVES